MRHDHLTSHQIAEAFGDTLSLIYRRKMEEINEELAPVYAFLDRLDQPKYSSLDRWFARATLPGWAQMHLRAIDHIEEIRRLHKRRKKMTPTEQREKLDIDRAKSVPITTLYDFVKKGKNVSCPWHPDKSPSMSLRNNRFHCFQCGARGDAIEFYMKINSVDFVTAVKRLTA